MQRDQVVCSARKCLFPSEGNDFVGSLQEDEIFLPAFATNLPTTTRSSPQFARPGAGFCPTSGPELPCAHSRSEDSTVKHVGAPPKFHILVRISSPIHLYLAYIDRSQKVHKVHSSCPDRNQSIHDE